MYKSNSRFECPEIVQAKSFVDLLEQRAVLQKDEIALSFLNNKGEIKTSLSYKELSDRSKTIANTLIDHEISGSVLLLYPPGLEFVEAFFGALYTKAATAVPVYPPISEKEKAKVDKIIRDSAAKSILCQNSVAPLIKAWLSSIEDFKDIQVVITDTLPTSTDSWVDPDLDLDDTAFLQYTSGSTSDPKGVIVSHGNLLHNMEVIQNSFQTREGEMLVCGWLPVYHDMGLIGNVLQPIYVGRPCLLMSPMDFLMKPFLWLKVISDYKVTTSGAPNFAYELCTKKVTDEQLATLDLSTWKVAFNGAEPIRQSTLEMFYNRFKSVGFEAKNFSPCYGLAESTLMVTGSKKDEQIVSQSVETAQVAEGSFLSSNGNESTNFIGSGNITNFQDIRIVEKESNQTLEDGKIGQIWVKGKSVALGYYNNPKQTEKTFKNWTREGEGPFLNTGDLGCIYNEELFITGREKDLLIFNGSNHYPQDIEQTVERVSSIVRKGCISAVSLDLEGETHLCLVAETNSMNADFETEANIILREVQKNHQLKASLVVFIKKSTIPKTSSGKIQRQKTKMQFLENQLDILYLFNLLNLNFPEHENSQNLEEIER
jgi:acyl-CoA synthetase (AMP-forming)/AMP-acid ligase II